MLRARLQLVNTIALLSVVFLSIVYAGFPGHSQGRWSPLGLLLILNMAVLAGSRGLRFLLLPRSERSFLAGFSEGLLLPALWLVSSVAVLLMTQLNPSDTDVSAAGNAQNWLVSTSIVFGLTTALVSLFESGRILAARTQNSALLLVGSFVVLISLGTLLLRLPVCRTPLADGSRPGAPWNVALFTSTSACCVTGLAVEPTGTYWSTTGHFVILLLIQLGGLGILTFGAFIAVLSGRRGLQFREAATFRDLMDSESLQASRRLLITILLFTFSVEAIGAVSLLGLWPDYPWPKRIWYAVFHSISAFCNAGFSLHDEGLLGRGTSWPVWGPICLLIICGGLGFQVAGEVATGTRSTVIGFWKRARWLAHSEQRLSIHSKLVLITTGLLLLSGTAGIGLLETLHDRHGSPSLTQQLADAWFQSVTLRTAGFNTIDLGKLHPATKLFGILLMFIGASPGSTGGGVKTVVAAIVTMNLWAVLRGRDGVEVFGRRIATNQVARSLCIVAVALIIVLVTTGLLAIFENKPGEFLDQLFEATSAFATVGVSTGITPGLTIPSRLLLTIVMFLGRVGPLTMLLAMVGNTEPVRYEFPEAKVSLG